MGAQLLDSCPALGAGAPTATKQWLTRGSTTLPAKTANPVPAALPAAASAALVSCVCSCTQPDCPDPTATAALAGASTVKSCVRSASSSEPGWGVRSCSCTVGCMLPAGVLQQKSPAALAGWGCGRYATNGRLLQLLLLLSARLVQSAPSAAGLTTTCTDQTFQPPSGISNMPFVDSRPEPSSSECMANAQHDVPIICHRMRHKALQCFKGTQQCTLSIGHQT
jgi:hypothetical protein